MSTQIPLRVKNSQTGRVITGHVKCSICETALVLTSVCMAAKTRTRFTLIHVFHGVVSSASCFHSNTISVFVCAYCSVTCQLNKTEC